MAGSTPGRRRQAMQGDQGAHHGRGATSNPPNRFTPLWHVRDPDWTDPEDPAPTTQFFKDTARSIRKYSVNPCLTSEIKAFASKSWYKGGHGKYPVTSPSPL